MYFVHNRNTLALDYDGNPAIFMSHDGAKSVARALSDTQCSGWEVVPVETIVVDDVLAQIDAQLDAELQLWLDAPINH